MAIAAIEKKGTTLNVCPEGRLDAVRTPQLDKELEPNLAGVSQIVMDFSKVAYVSSSCLRLLMYLAQEMKKSGGEVQVTHVHQTVLHVFEMTGFMAAVHVITD